MRTADCNGPLKPHQLTKHFCTAHNRKGELPGCLHFGIIVSDGCRDDQHIGFFDIQWIVTLKNFDAFFAQSLDVWSRTVVAALNLISQVVQDFCDSAHPDTANANKMERANIDRHLTQASGRSNNAWGCLIHANLNSDLA